MSSCVFHPTCDRPVEGYWCAHHRAHIQRMVREQDEGEPIDHVAGFQHQLAAIALVEAWIRDDRPAVNALQPESTADAQWMLSGLASVVKILASELVPGHELRRLRELRSLWLEAGPAPTDQEAQ